MDSLGDLVKKLFPLRGKQLDQKLQEMFDDAVAAESHERPKHALEQLSAIWESSVHTPTWKYRRQFELIPLMAKLAEHHEAARFKLRSMRDAQEKLVRGGDEDFAVIGEWCALNKLVEPERTMYVYDELKKHSSDYSEPILTRIRILEFEAFLEQGRYSEFLEEDLETLYEYLEDDATDAAELRSSLPRSSGAASGDDADNAEDDEPDDDDDLDDELYDAKALEHAVAEAQARATRLLQLALLKDSTDYVDDIHDLLLDSLDETTAFLCLIRGAEKAGKQPYIYKLLKEAKERLSPEQYAVLGERRGDLTRQSGTTST